MVGLGVVVPADFTWPTHHATSFYLSTYRTSGPRLEAVVGVRPTPATGLLRQAFSDTRTAPPVLFVFAVPLTRHLSGNYRIAIGLTSRHPFAVVSSATLPALVVSLSDLMWRRRKRLATITAVMHRSWPSRWRRGLLVGGPAATSQSRRARGRLQEPSAPPVDQVRRHGVA